MTLATANVFVEDVLDLLANARQTVGQINAKCAEKGLPPAIEFTGEGLGITSNTDYRFEGFGLVIGLPPKVSFYVHYKPDSPEHVELGRFLVPINLG